MQAENDLQKWRERIEIVLDATLPSENSAPQRLHHAMRYSCLGGGKRIRACLVYASGALFNGSEDALDVEEHVGTPGHLALQQLHLG